MDKNKIIKKSNNLVEAAYKLNLWEMRILIRMTSLIHMDDKDFEVYEISINDLKNFFNITNDGSVYKYIKDACYSLMDKKITIRKKLENGNTKETVIPMVIEMSRVIEDKSSISLSFHPKMKPYLLELKTKFLSYDVKNVVNLNSSHAIRLYELTKAYVGIGKRTISVENLKTILGIGDKYKQYSHLKNRVLIPSRENINENTDIILDYKEIKKGRKVTTIQFSIKRKEAAQAKEDESELFATLKILGVSQKTFNIWKSKYGEEHIITRIAYLKKMDTPEHPVKNKAAYLNSIMGKEIANAPQKMDAKEITKKVNGILFSNSNLESQIRQKHGQLSQEAIERVVMQMFPDKFN